MIAKLTKLLTLLGVISTTGVGNMADVQDPRVQLDPENTLYIELEWGRVTVKMFPEIAPNHVARVKELTRKKFYDGIVFHRVIDGFMAQTGDPTGTGLGGSGQNIDAEFTRTPHMRGTLSMARATEENSADSQFFICFTRVAQLDEPYTVWGRVVDGMEHVDKIKRGEPPLDPSKMVSVRVAADVDG